MYANTMFTTGTVLIGNANMLPLCYLYSPVLILQEFYTYTEIVETCDLSQP